MRELFEHVLNCSYIYDLIIKDNSAISIVNHEIFYPFRYSNAEFQKLMACEQANLTETFSLQWIHQLFRAVAHQKFDAHILNKLLSKLLIQPHEGEQETGSGGEFGIRRYSKMDRSVPRIFEMIVSLVNNYSVWEEITGALEFRLHKEQGQFSLANKYTHSPDSLHHYRTVFATLKLLRTIFRLNEVLSKYQTRCPGHFIVKTLASIQVLNRVEINTVGDKDKTTLLLSLLANLQVEQQLYNDSHKNIILEAEQEEEDESKRRVILGFLKNNQKWLDFEVAGNFVKSSASKYLENEDNPTTLALDNILHYLRLCPDCCLEFALQSLPELGNVEKAQFKDHMISKMIQTLKFYLTNPEYQSIRYKVLAFICDLKYGLGSNQLNHGLSDTLFLDFMRLHRSQSTDPKVNYLLLKFMAQ